MCSMCGGCQKTVSKKKDAYMPSDLIVSNILLYFNQIGFLKLISQGEADIRNGRARSQEDVFNDIEASLKDKLK